MDEHRARAVVTAATRGLAAWHHGSYRCLGVALALIASAVVVPAARADERDAPPTAEEPTKSRVRAELALATYVPVSMGLDAGLELPGRWLLRLHVGWMPQAYLQLINTTATGFGWYDDPTAELVEAAVDDAFVLRVSAGWRPLPSKGFEALFGYTLLAGLGDFTTSEIVEAATGISPIGGRSNAYELSSTMHALHVMLGWAFRPLAHLVVRVHLGFVYTVAVRTTVDSADSTASDDLLEAYIDDILETYGFTPELGLAVGWAF